MTLPHNAFEALEPRLLLSGVTSEPVEDVYFHGPSAPADVQSNSRPEYQFTASATGTILFNMLASRNNVFAFTAKTAGTVTISILPNGQDNGVDAKLTVRNANGQVVMGDNNASVYLTIQVEADQTYYIQAECANGAKYKLVRSKITAPVSTPSVPPAPIEPPAPPTPVEPPTPPTPPSPPPAPEPGPEPSKPTPPETNRPGLPGFTIPDFIATPSNTITTEVINTGAGLQLIVVGTSGNDTIVLSQTLNTLTLTTATETFVFNGEFTSIVVYGFEGNDTIQFTATVTAMGCIYGGEGNDTYYLAGSNTIWAFGGLGDDLYVAVGGGQSIITAGGGFNSYWVDMNDVIVDPSAAEIKAGAVHRIAEFYQPWSDKNDYIPLTPGGENFRDPIVTSYAKGYSNFSSSPLFVGGPNYTDINQGNVGDCYFLASLASLAETNPMVIQQAVVSLGDGTYAVRFYKNGKEVYVRVDGDLPVGSNGQLAYAKPGDNGAIWVAVMEKAYAFFRTGGNSYASINGGWMADAYADITGTASTTRTTGGSVNSVYTFLQTQLNDGKAVTAASTTASQGPIIGSHAYMIVSVQDVNGVQTVTVYNPWGYDGVKYDNNPNDGLITITVAQFQQYFSSIVANKAA
ncbi:MAG: C2 family cysteine protease [Phycisphaerae bacterium]|nr:C2 family cysteine protease [Phycisphaerae bacterium]